MSDRPARPARAVKLNVINEPKDSYTGGKSSLCPGCGHDQISNVIVAAAWENGIEPHRIAKMSGIGCSSKTPAYYLGQSHGFNTVHGRMPSVTTGAYAINKDLLYLGVSGDGDSASIGIGQLIHAIRRNMDMVYIVENNGVYGLTKGQYSATADVGSKKKKGKANTTQPIDLCALAINLGCTFVARSFSGSKKQLTSLLKAAMCHDYLGAPFGPFTHVADPEALRAALSGWALLCDSQHTASYMERHAARERVPLRAACRSM